MSDKQFYPYYGLLIISMLLPYMDFVFPFFPDSIAGRGMTGWAWMLVFAFSMHYLFSANGVKLFPVIFWIPWIVYIHIYLLFDFSYPGLQLTIQYTLPIIIGYVVSGFVYSEERLVWLGRRLMFVSVALVMVFFYGILYRGGFTPFRAQTPMLLSVPAALSIGIFLLTKRIKYLLFFMILFSVPFLSMTRMAILVYVIIFMFHFANKKLSSRLFMISLGVLLGLAVFYSSGFQEKTFYGGSGKIDDIAINYYEPSSGMNTSGRSGFLKYYEPGLKRAPLFGNGPRSDIYVLGEGLGLGYDIAFSNDYISVRYNYGYIGLGCLLFGILCTFYSLYARYKAESNPYSLLLCSTSMILIVVLLLFMYTEDILKYTIFFPNSLFAIIGMSFAKLK